MNTEILSKQVLDCIINDVETTICRLGINAKLSIKIEEDYRGKAYEKLVSTDFQMMPMIFKDIHLEGSIYIKDKFKASQDFLRVYIDLRYNYHTFDNCCNGHALGSIIYEISKQGNEEMKEDDNVFGASMVVSKVQPLGI